MSPQIVVVSIQLGTNRSGYSISYPNRDIIHSEFNSWGDGKTKTVAVISLDETGGFSKFGYDAREDHDNAIFSNYKMLLFDSESREKTMVKADNCDQAASVETLITESLKYLGSQARLKMMSWVPPLDQSVLWVITVPAIWDDVAKQVMRQCAINAGLCTIDNHQESLLLAYESDAGAVECIQSFNGCVEIGQAFLVCNLASNHFECSVYRYLADGNLESLITFGDNFGNIQCNQLFKAFILDLFGDEVSHNIIDSPYLMTLMDRFEILKQSMCDSCSNDGRPRHISFNPRDFNKSIDWLVQRVETYNRLHGTEICYKRSGHLCIPFDTFLTFFQPSFQKILEYMKHQSYLPYAIRPTYIFMVGGFSENYFLQQLVKQEFEWTGAQLVVPSCPHLSVLRGACRLGSTRLSTIFKRTLQRSYAAAAPGQSDECRLLARARDSILVNKTTFLRFIPNLENQQFAKIALYSSVLPVINKTTDSGVLFIGNIHFEFPSSGDSPNDRVVELDIGFGSTEIFVSAKHLQTNQKINATIDFINIK
ncbi:hypothetical protein DFA_11452 [Cavenderia fasciculata]|uniref:Uncharacterized protein n=1 Tax=Cavenderia fasciculata TaxID=261658 RepID=F4QD10_CACFS|nr:uncharacterized protein DFA_11452 [Cavenderia fasciculata]EGG13691.1 hypothetical protein DFA_11452 [Cavenderia fasciculata]|eukprot:XP_004350395.1 hypothetical protein DFA_11452 [Cavenderia fasciculata]